MQNVLLTLFILFFPLFCRFIMIMTLHACERFKVYKNKNEVECRDATMPKTVDTRNQDLEIGLRKIVACSQPYTCGAFLHVSTV